MTDVEAVVNDSFDASFAVSDSESVESGRGADGALADARAEPDDVGAPPAIIQGDSPGRDVLADAPSGDLRGTGESGAGGVEGPEDAAGGDGGDAGGHSRTAAAARYKAQLADIAAKREAKREAEERRRRRLERRASILKAQYEDAVQRHAGPRGSTTAAAEARAKEVQEARQRKQSEAERERLAQALARGEADAEDSEDAAHRKQQLKDARMRTKAKLRERLQEMVEERRRKAEEEELLRKGEEERRAAVKRAALAGR